MRTAPITDWAALWRRLVAATDRRYGSPDGSRAADRWRDRAGEFNDYVQQRWAEPDSSRDLVLSHLRPNDSVLDIGAGTGAWALLIAPQVQRVTALDPSPSMVEVLRDNLRASPATNVDVVEASWPASGVAPHDVTLCAHAMYGAADLPGFVEAMVRHTRRVCFLLVRSPDPDNVLTLASRRVWGQPHDAPNFTVAYNVLLEMGIRANVLMERGARWHPWLHDNPEAALVELKRRFGVEDSTEHDAFLADLLASQMEEVDGRCLWPRRTHSALVYWSVGGE